MQGLLTGLFLAASGVGNWVSTAILSIVQAATEERKLLVCTYMKANIKIDNNVQSASLCVCV